MRARVVIGANYGDEGKGLVTDYLCAQGAGMVVRFNGGAQAGHTVVMPEGIRHVFHHFGSGTLRGVPTFLSQFFICNPILYARESVELMSIWEGGELPPMYAHPDCIVTTFADMIINQHKHKSNQHGSCGVGINETVNRSQIDELKITMGDLWNNPESIEPKLSEICNKYCVFRTGKTLEKLLKEDLGVNAMTDHFIKQFIKACKDMAENVHPLGIQQCKEPVFEGAQGLLLDQNRKADMPHLTRSNTGMQNVRKLCAMGGFDGIDTYYVSRTYLTRHGNGPLPGEDAKLEYADNTNLVHPFQGALRFAPLDYDKLVYRCNEDWSGFSKLASMQIVLTHCDQKDIGRKEHVGLYTYGPTRNDIRTSHE